MHMTISADAALFIARLMLGLFFVLARFRWIYDPSRPEQPWFNAKRHEHLVWKLCVCGFGQHRALAASVALAEVAGGALVLVGLGTQLAALALFIVLLGATHCTAREKTMKQEPVDKLDVCSCYLWTVEPIYIGLALLILLGGPGAWSLDALIW